MLTILANSLNVRILRAHRQGPLRSAELVEKTGWPAQTTLRIAVNKLCKAGLLERQEADTAYGVATTLTAAGNDVLAVAVEVERWLARAPQGPIALDSDRGKGAIKSLTDGWNTKMVQALAYEPASLTELAQRIPEFSYPSIDRRFTRMRNTRQIEPSPTDGRGTPFEVSEWLRLGVAPLCMSVRCERLHMLAGSAPITEVEIEASFLLATPIAPLPETISGICVLSVMPEEKERHQKDDEPAAAGVTVEVDHGVVVRCVPQVDKHNPVWALGGAMEWLNAVIDGHFEGLRIGDGRPQLAAFLVNGLHLALFGDR